MPRGSRAGSASPGSTCGSAKGPGRGAFLAALGGSATLALFLIHKRPEIVGEIGPARINPILIAVGFSYVALRFYEVSRAVLEGRHPAPGLAATVNYLIPFHMLAAGPIQSYDDFAAQPPVPPPPTWRRPWPASSGSRWGCSRNTSWPMRSSLPC